jgi:circadian clock protein KaiC
VREKVRTGIAGLDSVLFGGVPHGATVLLEGAPGTGKTTLGLQFVYHGVVQEDEPGLFITFEELPEQIYQDAAQFGWDLRALEQQNKLRILCMSPEVLIEQMLIPGGIFEKVIAELGCKRIVIDSVSMLRNGTDRIEERRMFYRFRNILRKLKLTSILIEEQRDTAGEALSYQHYIVDGVIRLSLQEWHQKYRQRMLEVLKMRGSKFIEGEHIYRMTEEGIHLIPAKSMIEDIVITTNQNNISTGIPHLDQLLDGGIPGGSVFILDTNSKANYKYLVASIVTKRILAGEKTLVLPSSLTTIYELQLLWNLYGVSLEDAVRDKQTYFIEHYNRSVPPGLESGVINLSGLNNEEYKQARREKLRPIIMESVERGENWFVYYDLNTIFSELGKDFVMRFFSEETARARVLGLTILVLCNFAEINEETSAFLERTCNGVIRTWVDGRYQYLQVTKSPNGQMSKPLIVENIPNMPFIRLV